MNKNMALLAVLGLSVTAGAQAQSSVTIYGVVDTGYVKESGRDVRMGENLNNRLGFRGVEDLGNGLKATFDLQRRFDLNDGTLNATNTASFKGSKPKNNKEWDAIASVGLNGHFGEVRLGRVLELSTQTITRFDPFIQSGVGSWWYGAQRNRSLDNTVRYDSPKWNGLSFGTSYSLGADSSSGGVAHEEKWRNDGYAINVSYVNGPFDSTANLSRVADSNHSYSWNIGLAYKFANVARVSLLYEDVRSKGFRGGNGVDSPSGPTAPDGQEKHWLLGLAWDVGPGQLDTSVQYNRVKNNGSNGWNGAENAFKYALGYTYNLSKRTSIYGQVAYSDFDSDANGKYFTGRDTDSLAALQAGITHKF